MGAGLRAGRWDQDQFRELKHEHTRPAWSQEQERFARGAIEHIDHLQMAESPLWSRQRQRAVASMDDGAPAGPVRTCKHRRREFKVKLRAADGDRASCISSCKRDNSSGIGPAFGPRCQFCLPSKHLLALGSQGNPIRTGLERLLPGRDLSLPRFKSCAIVGRGRYLGSSGCGSEIEAHDAIFRTSCNPAVGDAPEDVGNRTDFDIWNVHAQRSFRNGYFYCRETDPQVRQPHAKGHWPLAARERPRVVLARNGDIENYIRMITTPRSKTLSSMLPILPLRLESNGKPIFNALGLSENLVPTTGWVSVMIAIRLCQEVTLYGYSTPPEAGGMAEWKGHSIAEEHKIWELLNGQELEVIAPRR